MTSLNRRLLQTLLACTAALGLLAATGAGGPPEVKSPPKGKPAKAAEMGNRYALLVGCTRYPNLAEKAQLKGPANDVVLVRQMLTERFGFPDKNIVTLSEASGGENKPTRAHIEREFRRLAEVVKPGDQVFIARGAVGHLGE